MIFEYPNFDPVAFSIFSLSIRWYALAYLVGIIYANFMIAKAGKWSGVVKSEKTLENLLFYLVIGIMLGGRLGYVFLYQPAYYFSHPLEILQTWHGGMSFHGGALGTVIAVIIFCRRNNISILSFLDLCALVAPLGIMLGRLANFINGELWGRPTGSESYGVIFRYVDSLPRHPSQLYEALLEGLIPFIILNLIYFLYFKRKNKPLTGTLTALYIIMYSIGRIICEMFRQPDEQIGFLFWGMTMGQFITIPMLVIGVVLLIWRKR